MKHMKSTWAAMGAALVLAACGGGNGTQTSKVSFNSMVNFGDSLSDVGTYKVGTVAALKGGQYTINSDTNQNWTALMAKQLALAEPCPAQTGLNGAAAQGFNVPVVKKAGCTNYAQGGARVTNPVGPGNALLGGANATLGQLTVPLVTQVSNHLTAVGGSFSGNEIVTVMAGGNDALINVGIYGATVAAANAANPASVPAAAAAAGKTATASMTTAGTELATLIKDQILAKGAKYVVVVNLPNLAVTPFAAEQEAKLPGTTAVISSMTMAFNTALTTGLAGAGNVAMVDAYTVITDQYNNPATYALSNVKETACNLTSPSPNALGSSLVCNASNTKPGDVSHYLFADTVHPTPYGYQLLAQLVARQMAVAGWL